MPRLLICLLLLGVCGLVSCGEVKKGENEFMISGSISGADGMTLTLEASTADSLEVLERVVLDETGNFNFHFPGRGPCIYRLSAPGPCTWYFLMDKDEAKIQANYANQDSFTVEGSGLNVSLGEYIKGFRKRYLTYLQAKSAEKKAEASAPGMELQVYEAKKDQALIDLNNFTKAYGDTASHPLLRLFACDQLESEYNYFYLENKLPGFTTDPIASKYLAPMYKKLDNIAVHLIAGEPWEINTTALGNKPFSFENLRGKYSILYFWGSNCEASKQENKVMGEMQRKYAGQNINFVGVSLDENLDAWRERIQKDSMTFDYHINQGGGWESRIFVDFQINTIPSTYLIGPEGQKLTLQFRAEEVDAVIKKYVK